LQRYVTAVSETFVWGENGPLITALREAAEGWPQTSRNERDYGEVMRDPAVTERTYAPTLAPTRETLIREMRRMICGVYRDLPTGFSAWGWKAVGSGRPDLELVRELFPDIRVVLLVRNPWDVARSIRRKGWIDRRGYYRDMADAAEHWMLRTSEFLDLVREEDERLFFLRYEELHQRLDALHGFLGVEVDEARSKQVLARRLGTAPRLSRFRLTGEDIDAVTRVAGATAAELGYAPPTTGPV
jgi:hypothetical protein